MQTHQLKKLYDLLHPDERFRLILAASARGDEAERDRLINTSSYIAYQLRDYFTFAQAFDELNFIVFIELADLAMTYREALLRADEELPDDVLENHGHDLRWFDLALAQGYLLRTRAAGWELFCQRQQLPPYLLWEMLPGYERLQNSIATAQESAFTEEGMRRVLNRGPVIDEPPSRRNIITVESVAAETLAVFEKRVRWYEGA